MESSHIAKKEKKREGEKELVTIKFGYATITYYGYWKQETLISYLDTAFQITLALVFLTRMQMPNTLELLQM